MSNALKFRRRKREPIEELGKARGKGRDTFTQMVGMNRTCPNKIENAKVDMHYTTLPGVAHAFDLHLYKLLSERIIA